MLLGLFPDADVQHESGQWHAMRCPFHGDRTASASYNPTSQRFRCHTCGVAGDGFDLIQEHERCDFATARARASELCGGEFISTEPTEGRSRLAGRRSKLAKRRRR